MQTLQAPLLLIVISKKKKKTFSVTHGNSITGDHIFSTLCYHDSPSSFTVLQTLTTYFLGDDLIPDYNFQAIKTGSSK